MDAVELPLWLEKLRQTEVIDRVRNDPRSLGNTTLGLHAEQAFQAIGGGQADFDAPRGDLTPDDLALLYAYWNQKGHLEELIEAFGQCFGQSESLPENPIVVDIGCGPCTGGLALAGTLPCFDYIGVDRAESMRRLGERLAASDSVPGNIKQLWAPSLSAVEWRSPSWRPVLVLLSYLFASPTLDAPTMFDDLVELLNRLGRGAVTVLYTNSTRYAANRAWDVFQKRLIDAGFYQHVDDAGRVVVERGSGERQRRLRYAVLHRPEQRRLALGAS